MTADRTRGADPEAVAAFFADGPGRDVHPDKRRTLGPYKVSALGIGTYLGADTDEVDARYRAAVAHFVRAGGNLIDTASVYRGRRSERAVGAALRDAAAEGVERGALVISTKGGYIPYEGDGRPDARAYAAYLNRTFVEPGVLSADETVGGYHCMTPRFLAHQATASAAALGVDTLDVYLLHNPEEQLSEVSRDAFEDRLRAAFAWAEAAADAGTIGVYGLATWNGFRAAADDPGYLDLARILELAREVGGPSHHLRVIQLPYNPAMPEAAFAANQRGPDGRPLSTLEAARAWGVSVMGSATLMQGKVVGRLGSSWRDLFADAETDAQVCASFSAATPGMTAPLVGMSRIGHVDDVTAVLDRPDTDWAHVFNALLHRAP